MRILLAVDELPRSLDALEWTATHAEASDRVTCVNVVPGGASPEGAPAAPGARGGYPGVGAWEAPGTHERALVDAQRHLRDHGIESEVKLVHGDPRSAILAEGEAGGYDLIVVGTRGSGLLGTLSSRIAQDAKCAVEIVGRKHLVHVEPR